MDKRIKTSLLSDVFNTIGVIPYNKKKIEKEILAAKWERFAGIHSKIPISVTDLTKDKSSTTLETNNQNESWDDAVDLKKLNSPTKIRQVKELLTLNSG